MAKNQYAQVLLRAMEEANRVSSDVRGQIDLDAALIALDDIFEPTEEQAEAFKERMGETILEIARLTTEDSRCDTTMEYSKEVIDRRLRQILGKKNYVPYDIRYGAIITGNERKGHKNV